MKKFLAVIAVLVGIVVVGASQHDHTNQIAAQNPPDPLIYYSGEQL
ncbi:hypothetical protein OS242_10310 [Tumebacillus sp. DT12]|uniref:Phr family secreted Rap phosphatase inhibitor n=1 Tax=Tumebacillus lacus TaxID=2995335 RepID=A0ABT3X1N7_9BACL|nr:hypothetical protein [Tumebacillus lacus]MCX7570356.1 hypothetical protein [Tumebacillus lacus]